jgi:hypothetical protein
METRLLALKKLNLLTQKRINHVPQLFVGRVVEPGEVDLTFATHPAACAQGECQSKTPLAT